MYSAFHSVSGRSQEDLLVHHCGLMFSEEATLELTEFKYWTFSSVDTDTGHHDHRHPDLMNQKIAHIHLGGGNLEIIGRFHGQK